MKVYINNDKKLNSKVLCEEYFSLQVDFGYELNKSNSYFQINNGSSQSLEVTLNENNELSKVMLLCSDDYSVKNEEIGASECVEGVIYFDKFANIDSELFEITVYNDAITLLFSSMNVIRKLKQGNLILSLDEKDKIVSFTVVNLKGKERQHILDELQYSKEEKQSN